MPAITLAVTTTNTTAGTVAVWATPLPVRGGSAYNVSVWGTFVGKSVFQRSFDGGTTWLNVAEYTAATEVTGSCPEDCLLRVGTPVSGWTSGTINSRIGTM